MPLSAAPGPTSTYVVTPSDARRCTTASQRTGDDTCRTRASIALAASRFLDLRGVEAENRRHRARADRHGFLHVAPSPADDAQRVAERKRPGGDVRRVLAEAVAGDERRRDAARRDQAARRRADRED